MVTSPNPPLKTLRANMEVIDKNGESIHGLYAAGVDTGGWLGDTYSSQLAGMTFGFAINSGCIAGENAAKFVFTRQSE